MNNRRPVCFGNYTAGCCLGCLYRGDVVASCVEYTDLLHKTATAGLSELPQYLASSDTNVRREASIRYSEIMRIK